MELCDKSVHPDEAPRLSRQCQEILSRLERGRATNQELAQIALKYTSRISDLRANGFQVEVVERDHATGLVWYEWRKPVGPQLGLPLEGK